jgi:hypothetical protein
MKSQVVLLAVRSAWRHKPPADNKVTAIGDVTCTRSQVKP